MSLLLKKKHLNLAKLVKDNELNKFFDSYSRIEIKHATSNRLLNSLTFTRYSLGELLKLVNIYRTENTPIKVSAIDYDGNEIDYSEVEKELERLYKNELFKYLPRIRRSKRKH